MPIYEYRAVEAGCEACADRFAVMQGMNDPVLEKCPQCGQPVKRLISNFADPKRSLAGKLSSAQQDRIDELSASNSGQVVKSKDGKKIQWLAPDAKPKPEKS